MKLALATIAMIAASWTGGCASRRQIDIEFSEGSGTGGKPADIQRVDVSVFETEKCKCADIGKPGCMLDAEDTVSSITFTPTTGQRTGGGFPDGNLTVFVAAYAPNDTPIPLRIACWCAPDLPSQSLVYSIGSPTVAAGQNCP